MNLEGIECRGEVMAGNDCASPQVKIARDMGLNGVPSVRTQQKKRTRVTKRKLNNTRKEITILDPNPASSYD